MNFTIFTKFPKSEVSIPNRLLGTVLRSKFNKKKQIGKLRVSAFQRLKNQRLRTSPSKVMDLSKFYKSIKIHSKFIKIIKKSPAIFYDCYLLRDYSSLFLSVVNKSSRYWLFFRVFCFEQITNRK